MIYGTARAAVKLGMSIRQLLRYTKELGKERSCMGSRRKMIFSEHDLEVIQSMREKNSLNSKCRVA